jgi:hypothetical protein
MLFLVFHLQGQQRRGLRSLVAGLPAAGLRAMEPATLPRPWLIASAGFDLQVKTYTGNPGQAMAAFFNVVPFLEALLGRYLVPPCRCSTIHLPNFAQVLPTNYTASVLALPFSMILDCLVLSNAGNETMIPSLGSPRASFVGPPTIALPADGVGWRYVGPDALEDVTV